MEGIRDTRISIFTPQDMQSVQSCAPCMPRLTVGMPSTGPIEIFKQPLSKRVQSPTKAGRDLSQMLISTEPGDGALV